MEIMKLKDNAVIKEITLLTSDEYMLYRNNIKPIEEEYPIGTGNYYHDDWWTKPNSNNSIYEPEKVNYTKNTDRASGVYDTLAVRPIMKIEGDALSTGSQYDVCGRIWTALDANILLCDEAVFHAPFIDINEIEDIDDVKIWEDTTVKTMLDSWANSIELLAPSQKDNIKEDDLEKLYEELRNKPEELRSKNEKSFIFFENERYHYGNQEWNGKKIIDYLQMSTDAYIDIIKERHGHEAIKTPEIDVAQDKKDTYENINIDSFDNYNEFKKTGLKLTYDPGIGGYGSYTYSENGIKLTFDDISGELERIEIDGTRIEPVEQTADFTHYSEETLTTVANEIKMREKSNETKDLGFTKAPVVLDDSDKPTHESMNNPLDILKETQQLIEKVNINLSNRISLMENQNNKDLISRD